jgi:hypothetical protein
VWDSCKTGQEAENTLFSQVAPLIIKATDNYWLSTLF